MNRSLPIRAVIFDLDGTLGETLPVCFAAFRAVFERDHGVTYDDAAIRAMFGPSDRGVLAANGVGDPDELLTEFIAEYRARHEIAACPFPGVLELLDDLQSRRIPVAVVTGKGQQSANVSLEHWRIQNRFTHVMAGDGSGDIKIENMRTVVDAWGFPGGSIVAIGDIDLDVYRAREAGIRAVAAAWSDHADPPRLRAANPEAVFGSVAEFQEWLTPRLSDHGSQSRPSGQNVK